MSRTQHLVRLPLAVGALLALTHPALAGDVTVALDAGAYRGLWQHILTHDLASRVVYESHPDDPFVDP